MRFLIVIPILIFHLNAFAQHAFDSAVFDNNFVFKNGIYTSLDELKYNSPSYPDCELEIDKNQPSISLDKLYYINSRKTRLKYDSYLYAIVVDGHLSVFYKNQLNSVFLKGAISTFILKEVVTTTSYQPASSMGYGYPYGGYGGGASMPVTTSHLEVNIHLLDFKTGDIARVDKTTLDPIIQRDPELYLSFKKIKGDANNKKSYPFISQYNTRNPIYILFLPAQNAEDN